MLVKEITRRFLPKYEALFALVSARAAEERAYRSKLVGAGVKLAEILGGKFDPAMDGGSRVEISTWEPRYLSASTCGERVDLKLSGLTFEEVAAILKIVRTK